MYVPVCKSLCLDVWVFSSFFSDIPQASQISDVPTRVKAKRANQKTDFLRFKMQNAVVKEFQLPFGDNYDKERRKCE